MTLRASLEQVELTTGIPEPELDVTPIPVYALHVWEWFWELNRGRTCGMAVNPITWPEIAAWSQLTGNRPRKWELDAITGIDNAYIASTLVDTETKKEPKK